MLSLPLDMKTKRILWRAVKLGIGGFSMGAATALYSATCHILGKYGNGNLYPVNLSAVVGLSGWLPCSRFESVHTDIAHRNSFTLIYVNTITLAVCFYAIHSAQ